MKMLHRAKSIAIRLWKDEGGASLLEYTLLIGIILTVTVGTIGLVGGWANTKWLDLKNALIPAPAPGPGL
jgi:pilus assembly protein Flp/PilA